MSPPGESVPELVARAAIGDRDAFATLYNEYRGEVYRFLFFKTRNRHLAEDLTQEVFVRALRRIDTFATRPGGSFAGWLVTIARNIHTDHCKASRTRLEVPIAEVFEANEQIDSAESGALRSLEAVEAAETVAVAMAGLNPYQRECIRLRFLEELSLDEAVAELGRPAGAVKTLTFRAMSSMRRTLAEGVAA
ncbi:sigma-70 family RNA polymerase sigma factor [Streptomyces sp. MBT62]|nr:sigma-70 family RNA polymerase sigma factor [Streptomyces sp. MBT62]MBK6013171.1 sigma-70 family RNA polymerase sigma factor [Streptomyces sp. MBT53]